MCVWVCVYTYVNPFPFGSMSIVDEVGVVYLGFS